MTRQRENKGKSTVAFPDDYVVFDLETTGLDPSFDEIIEIAALKVRNGEIVDSFSSLVNPEMEIDEFITDLTGITNAMLEGAPTLKAILPSVLKFIGPDIVVGHNINFDINFLYDACESLVAAPFSNDFIDTLRISRKALPELAHHRLSDVAFALNVVIDGEHRALCDCKTTFACFNALSEHISTSTGLDAFLSSFRKHYNLDLQKITSKNAAFDETHPLYGKHCVFTGTLERMPRADAAQEVVNVGGICDNGITKKTNFLILGNNDYCKAIKDGKSNKQKKAEEYILAGLDIHIIPENVFYEMLEQ